VLLVVMSWFGLALYTQSRLPFLENGAALCRPSAGAVGDIVIVTRDFLTRNVCGESFGRIAETQRYAVTFDVVDPWYDSSLATNPVGLGVGDLPWGLGYAAAPFRRVIDARYLQPVLAILPDAKHMFFDENIQLYPLELRAVGNSVTLYRAEFVAPRNGELFMFVNDAMIPLRRAANYFYESSGWGPQHVRGNRGSACVTVERVSMADRPIGSPIAESVCAQAAARNAELARIAQALQDSTTLTASSLIK
jgi:hypothetical protein